jgi:hypothetical protein
LTQITTFRSDRSQSPQASFSTEPGTNDGKKRSRRNALRYGLTALHRSLAPLVGLPLVEDRTGTSYELR